MSADDVATVRVESLRADVEAMEAWRDDQDVAVPLGELRAVVAALARLAQERDEAQRERDDACRRSHELDREAEAEEARAVAAEQERDELEALCRDADQETMMCVERAEKAEQERDEALRLQEELWNARWKAETNTRQQSEQQ